MKSALCAQSSLSCFDHTEKRFLSYWWRDWKRVCLCVDSVNACVHFCSHLFPCESVFLFVSICTFMAWCLYDVVTLLTLLMCACWYVICLSMPQCIYIQRTGRSSECVCVSISMWILCVCVCDQRVAASAASAGVWHAERPDPGALLLHDALRGLLHDVPPDQRTVGHQTLHHLQHVGGNPQFTQSVSAGLLLLLLQKPSSCDRLVKSFKLKLFLQFSISTCFCFCESQTV